MKLIEDIRTAWGIVARGDLPPVDQGLVDLNLRLAHESYVKGVDLAEANREVSRLKMELAGERAANDEQSKRIGDLIVERDKALADLQRTRANADALAGNGFPLALNPWPSFRVDL